jgi:nucleoside-diphosphate-sugar epimerase
MGCLYSSFRSLVVQFSYYEFKRLYDLFTLQLLHPKGSIVEMRKRRLLCTGGSGFIGTHLSDAVIASKFDFINIDIQEPKKSDHYSFWKRCNILDMENLQGVFHDFQPTHVVHLAARAQTDGKTLDDFRDNTEGTANVLEAVNETPTISRVIIASSQHVRKPGSGLPQHDQDFNPHGLYGESKVITEQLTHQANMECVWTIIRPTTVWGSYHPFLVSGLWNLMKKGLYVHPKNDPVVRSYGYVKNVVWGIEKLLDAPSATVNRIGLTRFRRH